MKDLTNQYPKPVIETDNPSDVPPSLAPLLLEPWCWYRKSSPSLFTNSHTWDSPIFQTLCIANAGGRGESWFSEGGGGSLNHKLSQSGPDQAAHMHTPQGRHVEAVSSNIPPRHIVTPSLHHNCTCEFLT